MVTTTEPMPRAALIALVVAVPLAAGALVLNLYRASQELGRLVDLPPRAAPAVLPSAATRLDSERAEPAGRRPGADSFTDPADEPPGFDTAGDLQAETRADEAAAPLASIERLLSDPDPEVRSEAAALLEAYYAEQAAATAEPLGTSFAEP